MDSFQERKHKNFQVESDPFFGHLWNSNGFYGQDIVMAFSPPEYCTLFAQKKAYQEGVTGTPGTPPP